MEVRELRGARVAISPRALGVTGCVICDAQRTHLLEWLPPTLAICSMPSGFHQPDTVLPDYDCLDRDDRRQGDCGVMEMLDQPVVASKF